MDTSFNTSAEPLNWADYWDALTDEYFALRAAAEPWTRIDERAPVSPAPEKTNNG